MADPRIEQYAKMGFELGYNDPTAEPGIPLDEPWMSYYVEGMEVGRQVRAEADAQYEGPAIGPDRGGESLEQYNQAFNELLERLLERRELHPEEKFPGKVPEIAEGPGVE